MKVLVLILSLCLSLLGERKAVSFRQYETTCPAIGVAGQDRADQQSSLFSQAILPVQAARFSGDNTNVSPSARSSNTGRRTQVSHKFPFRIIKDGKVVDRYHFFVFQAVLNQFSSGIHSTGRYIHSLCSLLI